MYLRKSDGFNGLCCRTVSTENYELPCLPGTVGRMPRVGRSAGLMDTRTGSVGGHGYLSDIGGGKFEGEFIVGSVAV